MVSYRLMRVTRVWSMSFFSFCWSTSVCFILEKVLAMLSTERMRPIYSDMAEYS